MADLDRIVRIPASGDPEFGTILTSSDGRLITGASAMADRSIGDEYLTMWPTVGDNEPLTPHQRVDQFSADAGTQESLVTGTLPAGTIIRIAADEYTIAAATVWGTHGPTVPADPIQSISRDRFGRLTATATDGSTQADILDFLDRYTGWTVEATGTDDNPFRVRIIKGNRNFAGYFEFGFSQGNSPYADVQIINPGNAESVGIDPGIVVAIQAFPGISNWAAAPEIALVATPGAGSLSAWARLADQDAREDVFTVNEVPQARVLHSSTWLMRYNPTLAPGIQIEDDSEHTWDVVAVRELDRRRNVFIDCTRIEELD